jgi:hypothetical protein
MQPIQRLGPGGDLRVRVAYAISTCKVYSTLRAARRAVRYVRVLISVRINDEASCMDPGARSFPHGQCAVTVAASGALGTARRRRSCSPTGKAAWGILARGMGRQWTLGLGGFAALRAAPGRPPLPSYERGALLAGARQIVTCHLRSSGDGPCPDHGHARALFALALRLMLSRKVASVRSCGCVCLSAKNGRAAGCDARGISRYGLRARAVRSRA